MGQKESKDMSNSCNAGRRMETHPSPLALGAPSLQFLVSHQGVSVFASGELD